VTKLESTIAQQQEQIEALAAGLQKVSAQLAAASPSRSGLEVKVVSNNQESYDSWHNVHAV
jgi:hypothetical protein